MSVIFYVVAFFAGAAVSEYFSGKSDKYYTFLRKVGLKK